MDERVLITGGAGFIGLHLAQALLARGAQVTLVDNFSRGRNDAQLQDVLERATLVQLDLTHPMPNAALRHDYTHIYHMAAVVGVHTSNERPEFVLRTNLLATVNLLDWCSRYNPVPLCFASTSEVYAGGVALELAALPTPESTPLVILDPELPRYSYLASKIVGEQLCLSYAKAHNFTPHIVRYHNVYGPRMGYDHVIPQFIQRLLAGHNPFAIYGAYQTRAFCYVDDAVTATIQAMHIPGEEAVIVNVGNDQEEIQIIDMAQKLFRVAGISPQLAIYDPPHGSPERRSPNISRLQALTDYRPQISLEEGLARTYVWYRQQWERQQAALGSR